MKMKKEIQGIVEIGSKPIVERTASATGTLHLKSETKQAIIDKMVKKGDVLEASTIAAIQAVKETPRIIPHCTLYHSRAAKSIGNGKNWPCVVQFMFPLTTKLGLRWKQ